MPKHHLSTTWCFSVILSNKQLCLTSSADSTGGLEALRKHVLHSLILQSAETLLPTPPFNLARRQPHTCTLRKHVLNSLTLQSAETLFPPHPPPVQPGKASTTHMYTSETCLK